MPNSILERLQRLDNRLFQIHTKTTRSKQTATIKTSANDIEHDKKVLVVHDIINSVQSTSKRREALSTHPTELCSKRPLSTRVYPSLQLHPHASTRLDRVHAHERT